jgi:hypothetical protein
MRRMLNDLWNQLLLLYSTFCCCDTLTFDVNGIPMNESSFGARKVGFQIIHLTDAYIRLVNNTKYTTYYEEVLRSNSSISSTKYFVL